MDFLKTFELPLEFLGSSLNFTFGSSASLSLNSFNVVTASGLFFTLFQLLNRSLRLSDLLRSFLGLLLLLLDLFL